MDESVRKAEGRSPKVARRPAPEIRNKRDRFRKTRLPELPARSRAQARPSQILAVTFDVGGTLIQCHPSVGHIYAEVAARHGCRASPALLNRRFKNAWQALQAFRHTRSQWAELVDATFSGLVDPPPSQTFFPELYERFTEPDAWHLFEDVVPVLQRLKKHGLKLGVISNWDDRLRPLLRRLELDVYFDAIAVSCETGFAKPAPELFAGACALLRTAPRNTLHIGDDPELDVRGARAAGLAALRLRRGAKPRAGQVLGSLGELYKL